MKKPKPLWYDKAVKLYGQGKTVEQILDALYVEDDVEISTNGFMSVRKANPEDFPPRAPWREGAKAGSGHRMARGPASVYRDA